MDLDLQIRKTTKTFFMERNPQLFHQESEKKAENCGFQKIAISTIFIDAVSN